MTTLHVLLLEDSPDDAMLIERGLEREGYAVEALRVETRSDFEEALDRDGWDVILADFALPNWNGLAALELAKAHHGRTPPFVLVSGQLDEQTGVEAMRAGAADYLPKSDLARLGAVVKREVGTPRRPKRRDRVGVAVPWLQVVEVGLVVVLGAALAAVLLTRHAAVQPTSTAAPATTTEPTPPVIPHLANLPANYTFDGGTPVQQAEVTAALGASGMNWFLVPQTVTIHIQDNAIAEATPGNIWLSPGLLSSGEFAWATVQHEYAHQIDFYVLNDDDRAILTAVLGGHGWNPPAGTPHSQITAERFASETAWAYWPSFNNSLMPHKASDEAGGMDPTKFRNLMNVLIGAPTTPGAVT